MVKKNILDADYKYLGVKLILIKSSKYLHRRSLYRRGKKPFLYVYDYYCISKKGYNSFMRRYIKRARKQLFKNLSYQLLEL